MKIEITTIRKNQLKYLVAKKLATRLKIDGRSAFKFSQDTKIDSAHGNDFYAYADQVYKITGSCVEDCGKHLGDEYLTIVKTGGN